MKVPLTQVPSEQGNKRSGWMKHSGLGLKVQVEGTVSLDLGSSGPGESSAPLWKTTAMVQEAGKKGNNHSLLPHPQTLLPVG